MSEHFIKNIEIRNFKCFEDFKAEGFGRVNLIGGKNNVGKTAFMEACYLSIPQYKTNNDDKIIDFFWKLTLFNINRDGINLKNRFRWKDDDITEFIQIINHLNIKRMDLDENEYYLNVESRRNRLSFKQFKRPSLLLEKPSKFYSTTELTDFLNFNIKNKNYSTGFISSSSSYSNSLLEELISCLKEEFKYEDLNDIIYDLFGFDKIDILRGIPKILKDNHFFPLKDFGQGIKSFIYIIASILIGKDEVIFIDEIENGIHYSILDELWKIILTISKQQNVQVFATTHSKECIESYARVVEELNDKDITFIKLGKNRKDEIKAMIYPYEWFVDSIEQEEEVRGW